MSDAVKDVEHLPEPAPRALDSFRSFLKITSYYGRPHRRWLTSGALAAAVVIACRLSIPQLARVALSHWSQGRRITLARELTESLGGDPLLVAGIACLVICLILGFADHLERLWFARFSILLAKDLRRTAFARIAGSEESPGRKARADLVSRLVGDVAKIKSGLKGFLVHVARGGLLLLGVIAILLWTSPALGLIFAGACVLLGVATAAGARAAYHRALKSRRREGKLIGSLQLALKGDKVEKAMDKLDRSVGKASAALTRVQGRATMAAHGLFGLSVLLGLLVGAKLTESGALTGDQLVVFVLYAFMMRRPMVLLARQGARTGKIVAAVERLGEVLEPEAPRTSRAIIPEVSLTSGTARSR